MTANIFSLNSYLMKKLSNADCGGVLVKFSLRPRRSHYNNVKGCFSAPSAIESEKGFIALILKMIPSGWRYVCPTRKRR